MSQVVAALSWLPSTQGHTILLAIRLATRFVYKGPAWPDDKLSSGAVALSELSKVIVPSLALLRLFVRVLYSRPGASPSQASHGAPGGSFLVSCACRFPGIDGGPWESLSWVPFFQ